ncbi:hypothetical protein [Mesoterricola silvestris]|uniref:Uncharacterized protein n=1 Tax=Mesoterricola silvestris TaxID=2927979 RepID=A0AA48GMN7_9BACT|nr:hypothetical protein [Mesoterricola silvestris]BDU74139.1 hypothetical protein METEAL_33130 [Mesoterricola silvestris]
MATGNGRFGTALMAGLVAATLGLHAEDRKKEEGRERKQEPARPAPKAEPRPEPRQERRSEPRMEPRQERRPEPRQEPRQELRQERRPEPRMERRVEPRPEPRNERRTETQPEPRTERRMEARPESRPDRRIEPRPDSRPSGVRPAEVRPGPAGRGPVHEVVRTREGGEIRRTPAGAIREVRTPGGAVIRHSPSGVRQVEVVRPGGRVIVANATGRAGYIQRPLEVHGHSYVQRTYIVNGVPHAAVYRPWFHGGREYVVYMPRHYYRPAFYTWCYSPWSRPVAYSWGWSSRPWYGYYGGYFTPYPVYRSPAFWLADFIIAASLESAYMAQNVTVSSPPVVYDTSTGLSPEVKDAIADEVRRQMDQAKAAQDAGDGSAPPPIFTARGPRIFVVASGVMAYAGNSECSLVEGDVLQLSQTPAPGDEWAEVRVLSTRGASCPRGSYVSVRTTDLQEMQNTLQASMERGLAKLQTDQGRNGIPALPASAQGTVDAPYAQEVRPDADAQAELARAVGEANSSERSLIQSGGETTASGTTISLGMTPGQVEAALGRPKNTVDLGAKKIYVYRDLKITFLNGRVSDVQ